MAPLHRLATMETRDTLRLLNRTVDRFGRTHSLGKQHADHERVAREQGWILDEESCRDESIWESRL